MIFNEMDITSVINPLVGMGAVSVHVSVSIWSSSVSEEDHNLMLSLWSMLPEVENLVSIGKVGGWVSLLGMKEIWELNWIVNEENWSVVSNHVVVALLGVELNGEASWVSDSVWLTSLTSDG